MIRVLTKELDEEIKGLFSNAQKSITIVSPYLAVSTAKMLCNQVKNNPKLKCSFITRLYFEELLSGSNSLDAIGLLIDAGISVYSVKGLHTKLYLFDEDRVIVGSANFTVSGLKKNIELSILLENEEVISVLRNYVNSIIEQCKRQDEGMLNKTNLNSIETAFNEYKRKHDTGVIQRSTKMIGAELEPNEFIRNFDLEKEKKELGEGRKFDEKDYVYELFKDEAPVVIDSTMKVLLKLEGVSFNPEDRTEVTEVEYKGRTIYILNFPKRPGSIVQSTPFYLTRAYKEKGRSVHVIVGRGIVSSFVNSNVVRGEWVEKYEWMEKKKYYVVIKKMEILNTEIRNGVVLDNEVMKLGGKFYSSTATEDLSLKQIHQRLCRQSFLYITPIAKNNVDQTFDELVKKYGSHVIYSQT